MGKRQMGDLTRALLLASCLAAFGCSGGGDDGGGSGEGDGGAGDGDGDTSEPLLCESDDECSDEVFCNGAERCNPEHADADAFGCLPAADEPCSEGNSCNEQDDACGCEDPDADGDGSESEACGGDDCDDDDANRYPGNEETCDGEHHDEDCDAETYGFRDQDGDEDPDDECCNETESGDLNCGTDCNDNRGNQHSFNTEVCDDIDNDCDELVDEAIDGDEDDGLKTVFTIDDDEDGWGSDADDADTVFACEAPEGYVESATDCDDDDNQRSPSATEVCDDVDNDCDGLIDESIDGDEDDGLKTVYTVDSDNDLFGSDADDAETVLACAKPEFYSESTGDCDEGNPDINPGEIDSCTDNIDNDCSGVVNDPIGGCLCEGNETQSCAVSGALGKCATFTQQCNDGVWDDCPLERDNEPEVCDAVGVDENCDGYANNALGSTVADSLQVLYYRDRDGDDYPDLSTTQAFCPDLQSAGWITDENPEDCVDELLSGNPLSGDINPGETEVCNGRDDNCDNIVDGLSSNGDLEPTFYHDDDGDDQGGTDTTTTACTDPGADWYATAQDCNDNDATIYLGAQESCDGVDEDCDGLADVDDAQATNNCDVTGQIASAVCAVDECLVDECSGAYLDCDTSYDCETNGATDFDNCGECGTSCYQHCRTSSCDEFVQIEGGSAHTCARTESGLVRCWGLNSVGQLGDTTTSQRTSPRATAGVSGATDLAVGYRAACATSGSSLWCWGQLDDIDSGVSGTMSPVPGEGAYSATPLAVAGLTNPTQVAVGNTHVCVIETAGSVKCWGAGEFGQIGHNSTGDAASPQTVQGVGGTGTLGNVIAVTAGLYHTCAIVGATPQSTAGQVVCWGSNYKAQLGDGSSSHGLGNLCEYSLDCIHYPVQVVGPAPSNSPLADAVAIDAGGFHTCAIRQSGQVVCWGANTEGQLGDGSMTNRNTWVNATGVTAATKVSGHHGHSCAVSGGQLKCWGANDESQLGDGQTHQSCSGLDCSTSAITLGSPIATVADVGTGYSHTCAIRPSGQAYCWGLEDNGRLGNGTLNTHATPFSLVREP